MLLMCFISINTLVAQSKTVTGTVTDGDSTLPGVSVVIKGTTAGTETDFDGNYSISVKVGDVLQFSFVGMTTVERTVGAANVIDVVLQSDNVLDEVVVVGYGIQESETERTGAYLAVDSEDIANVSVTSFDQALQGRVPGLAVGAASGQPGSVAPVFIRGINSLTSSSQPLYVLNGVPLVSTDVSNIAETNNPLASINPNDIEDVRVLKDAASTSIYGSRGANGVILITTKSGKNRKGTFTFTAETGFGSPAVDKFDWLNASEHIDFTAQGVVNSGTAGITNIEDARAFATNNLFAWDGVTDTDWTDLTTNNNASSANYNLSYRGGGENLSMFASLGYLEQEGISREAFFDRVSGNISVDWKSSDKLSIGFNMLGSLSVQDGESDGTNFRNPTFYGNGLSPTQQPFNADGTYNTNLVAFNGSFNPVAIQDVNFLESKLYKFLTTIHGTYQFHEYLSFRSQFSVDYTYLDEAQWDNPEFGDGVNNGDENGNGNGLLFDRNITIWNWQNSLTFSKTFASIHDVSATLGMESTYSNDEFSQAWGQGYPEGRRFTSLAFAANPTLANSDRSEYSFVGYFLRAAYSFDSKYSLTGSYRIDQSSRFGVDNRTGDFYSVGASWNMHRESFMENSIFNRLKWRFSYGTVGNAEIGNYRSIATAGSENIAGQTTFRIDNAGNRELTWEQSEQLNLGLDFGLLNNTIFGSVDVYRKITDDLLFNAPVPASSSATETATTLRNIGSIENKGIEVLLGVTPFNKENLNWTLTGTFSYNDSEVTKITDDTDEVAINGRKRLGVGHNPSEFYTRLWAGVNAADGTPLWYTDETRTQTTGDVTQAQLSYTGEVALPPYIASLNSDFRYKDFSFKFLLNYSGGHSVYESTAFVYDNDGRFFTFNRLRQHVEGAWTPGRTDATRPGIRFNTNNNSSSSPSTRYLYDASHIRLRSIEFGYNIADKVLGNSSFVNNIYLYVKGLNLATWLFDDDIYFDPEVANNALGQTAIEGAGIYNGTQPILKQFQVGINVNF